ncbi:MAG: TetR/AcrR family transcriptional regulator [Thermocrispum sp.]
MPDQNSVAARRGDQDGPRKAELLDKLLTYSADHGLSGVSLRPLAAAVGSSPRVLLYFFGSKAELVRAVHQHARAEQLRVLDEALAGHRDPAAAMRALWRWLADPAHHNVERFFFEGYARSLHDADGPWRGFGADSVHEWLPRIEAAVASSSGDAEATGGAEATLLLAALRGLLLDLLATNDTARVQAAAERLLAVHVAA